MRNASVNPIRCQGTGEAYGKRYGREQHEGRAKILENVEEDGRNRYASGLYRMYNMWGYGK